MSTVDGEGGRLASGKRGFGARVKQTIGELLVADGLIDPEQVEEALSVQKTEGRRIVQTLVDLGHIDVVTFAKFLASRRGVPSIDLSNYEIQPELCALIPFEFAQKHEVFPIDKMGRLLTVGMVTPLDSATIEELEGMTGLRAKAVLCSSEDIHTAIKNHYKVREPAADELDQTTLFNRIESAMKLERIAGLVQRIDALPTLPDTVQKVQELSEDPNASIQQVVDVVAFDPALSARLLQIANSAAYGLPAAVESVAMAVKLMGQDEVYSVVRLSPVLDVTKESKMFDHEALRSTSRFCALAAKNISNASRLTPAPGIFTAGLLLDIGRFTLAEMMPRQYGKIAPDFMGRELADREEWTFGVAHPEVGYLCANHWGLPPEIAEAIRFHHAPEMASEPSNTLAIISLAAHMTDAHSQEEAAAPELFASCDSALTVARLDAKKAARIYADTVETYDANAGEWSRK